MYTLLVCAFGLALPRRLFLLLTHTSGHVCGVCGVLYRLYLTSKAHFRAFETTRRQKNRHAETSTATRQATEAANDSSYKVKKGW